MTTLQSTDLGLCPLPYKFFWKVELITRLNSVHLALCKRWSLLDQETSMCSVLDALDKPVDVWVSRLVLDSHKIWNEYTMKNKADKQLWRDRAIELKKVLGSDAVVKVR